MTSSEPEHEAQLRQEAEDRLKSGIPSKGPDNWTLAPDALEMLYRLASSQEGAADALKLLHELQVHQVELGLQHEQMAATEREMAESLTQCRDLYEWAPLGYFVVGRDGAVLDVNHAGVRLLGVARDAVVGRNLSWFIGNESRSALYGLLSAVGSAGDRAGCDIRFNQSGIAARIAASVPPTGEIVLMIASEQQVSTDA